MKIFAFLRSFCSYFVAGIVILFTIPPAILLLFLPRSYREENKLFFFLSYLFYRGVVWSTFLPFKIYGKENLKLDEPVIIIANHQSALDIPIVGSLCYGMPHVWFVLEYYVKKPILGFFIKRMYVTVQREDPAKAAYSLIKMLKYVQNKPHQLIIFPEGGRFTDGKVHDFFEGYAIIAKKTGRKVIPIYMPNNGKFYPPGSFLVNYYPIEVFIGKAMNIGPDETSEEFNKRIHKWFEDCCNLKICD